jgi:NADH:ubiquinone oxidoreductase subunit E
MVEIYICMGSACYLKGSKDIVDILGRLVKKYDLKEKVKLKGSFCLGPCNQGVVVKVEDKFFREKIYPYILEILEKSDENE